MFVWQALEELSCRMGDDGFILLAPGVEFASNIPAICGMHEENRPFSFMSAVTINALYKIHQ